MILYSMCPKKDENIENMNEGLCLLLKCREMQGPRLLPTASLSNIYHILKYWIVNTSMNSNTNNFYFYTSCHQTFQFLRFTKHTL